MRQGRRLLVVLTPLVLLVGACTEEEPASTVLPSSAFRPTGPTAGSLGTGPAGAPATGATGRLPTGPPGAATGNLSSGRVALNVTGDLRVSTAITNLVSSIYAPPPGGMALVWTAGGADATTVGLGGSSFTGSRPTAPELSLTVTVQADGTISTFLSSAGECTITIGVAQPRQVAGTFSCADLRGGDGDVVDVTGSFNARG